MPREGRSRYGLSPVGKWQGEINEPAMYTAKFKHKSVSYENPINPMTIYLTNRSQVAVRLFSNRPHFDVLCPLLLNRRTATWNLFVLYNKEFKKVLRMTLSIRLSSNRS